MNRLTRKTTVRDWIEDCEVCDITFTKPYATFEEFEKENPYQYILENLNENEELNKMGKFEDIMEEFNIDSPEELEVLLKTLRDNTIKTEDYDVKTETFYSEDLNMLMYHEEENYALVKKVLWGSKERK